MSGSVPFSDVSTLIPCSVDTKTDSDMPMERLPPIYRVLTYRKVMGKFPTTKIYQRLKFILTGDDIMKSFSTQPAERRNVPSEIPGPSSMPATPGFPKVGASETECSPIPERISRLSICDSSKDRFSVLPFELMGSILVHAGFQDIKFLGQTNRF